MRVTELVSAHPENVHVDIDVTSVSVELSCAELLEQRLKSIGASTSHDHHILGSSVSLLSATDEPSRESLKDQHDARSNPQAKPSTNATPRDVISSNEEGPSDSRSSVVVSDDSVVVGGERVVVGGESESQVHSSSSRKPASGKGKGNSSNRQLRHLPRSECANNEESRHVEENAPQTPVMKPCKRYTKKRKSKATSKSVEDSFQNSPHSLFDFDSLDIKEVTEIVLEEGTQCFAIDTPDVSDEAVDNSG